MSRSTFITIDNAKFAPDNKTVHTVTVRVMDDEGSGSFSGDLNEYWADMIHKDLARTVRKIRKLVK